MSQRVIVTAGHVDHGKSTLLRALTGMEPDRLEEERRRGLTIDLGFVWCELAAGVTTAFVDVPGHERFVATMLAGAAAAPAALMVVAADDGWSAQSAEHRDILDLLGVPAVAVTVSKADTVDGARVDEVAAELRRELTGTSLEDAPVVVTDAVTGRGLDDLRAVLRARLDELPEAADIGRPRLWVDRSFAVTGAGTVVTGTLTQGRFEVGQEVRVLPADRTARIRGLQSLGERVEAAGPGTRVAINLAGIDVDEVDRGDVVAGGAPWRSVEVVDAVVRVLPGHEVDRRGAWHLHVGTADTTCRLLPVTGPIRAGRGAGSASTGAVRVVLDRALPLTVGDRFVLREAGRRATVAGGEVAEPDPAVTPRGRRQRAHRASELSDILAADAAGRVRALLAARGGIERADTVLALAGWPHPSSRPAGVRRIGEHLALETEVARWATAVRDLGAGTHDRAAVLAATGLGDQHPRSNGGARTPVELASDLADHLVEAGALVRVPGGYSLPDHADEAAASRARRTAALVAELEAAPFSPPDLDERARHHGVDHREVNELVQHGEIVRAGRVAFARSAVHAALERLEALQSRVGPFTAAQAKEAWGTTRKYAIPLLEHLDRVGATSFDGNLRTLTGRRPS